MAGFTYTEGFTNDLVGWTMAMEKTVSVPSYKRFLEVTSNFNLVVVANDPTLTNSNNKAQCHENCRLAELQGVGERVSGWHVFNEFIFSDFTSGMMRLVHHSNLILPNGTYINPTRDRENSHHIFLRDDKRQFDFMNLIGFNDRMIFGDNFMVGRDRYRAVPRNKVLFASDSEYDRDLIYEKFKVHKSQEDVFADMPSSLNHEQQKRWMILKSSARFKS